LMDNVYYKEVQFDLLYPVWFKKFILRIVRPVVTLAPRMFHAKYQCIPASGS